MGCVYIRSTVNIRACEPPVPPSASVDLSHFGSSFSPVGMHMYISPIIVSAQKV